MPENLPTALASRTSPHRFEAQYGQVTAGSADSFPAIPALSTTRIRLEMLVMRSSVIDLRAITEVILGDAGATLQLLRVIGEEFGSDERRPTKIGHCIASLNHERWYEAVCGSVVDRHHGPVSDAWQQFRRCAQRTRQVAMRLDEFSAEEAYLVGLLHQMGKLPQLLGWEPAATYSFKEEKSLGLMLAQYWRLPFYLVEAMRQQQEGLAGLRWNVLLRTVQWEAQQSQGSQQVLGASC